MSSITHMSVMMHLLNLAFSVIYLLWRMSYNNPHVWRGFFFFLDRLNPKIYRQISLNLLNKNLQGKRLNPFFVLLVTPLFVDILTYSNIVYYIISKDIINECFLVCFSKKISLIWSCHHYRWRVPNLDLYSALMAIKQRVLKVSSNKKPEI